MKISMRSKDEFKDIIEDYEKFEGYTVGKLDTKDNIEKKFGYRDMGDGRIIPQSYCKKYPSAGCKAGYHCKVK